MLCVIKYAPADLKLTVVTTVLRVDTAAEWVNVCSVLRAGEGRLPIAWISQVWFRCFLKEDTANDVISTSDTAKYIWSGEWIWEMCELCRGMKVPGPCLTADLAQRILIARSHQYLCFLVQVHSPKSADYLGNMHRNRLPDLRSNSTYHMRATC